VPKFQLLGATHFSDLAEIKKSMEGGIFARPCLRIRIDGETFKIEEGDWFVFCPGKNGIY
jgi:hypothetical protein